ncbi:hypothetical protein ST201phi2-1p468 [Pseudomonas phage 201phi2-1]|uniref:Uncharacterized protein n=1 Tax=Pseudomonas phage 201phi2-1 TaxID=198110 RepID=B3FJX6_BP201|nr:hypothetical protein ST201phi2-1p468 [Pseudomonas phage 201phi2-1]ABY63291.1 hypothetical protein 201phi2-1p468 [Pseudomonas phage 201phi2-1]
MENTLFNKLTESMQSFNTSPLFDIPTGKYLEGGDLLKGLAGHAVLHKGGPSIQLITKLWALVEEYEPNTVSRYTAAYHLLRVMGYDVRWEDTTKCPDVFWINTEGNGEDEAKMIHDILHRDYKLEPKADLPEGLSGAELYEWFKGINNKEPVLIIDSISQESTPQS